MASDALFAALAEALSQPSRAYRTAQAALGVPQQALKGYVEGGDIADKINQRKLNKQTLEEALQFNVPERVQGYSSLTVPTIKNLGGLDAIAKLTEPTKQESPSTLESILAEQVRSGKMTMKQAAAAKRSMSPGVSVKPPLGYRYDANGNLIAIPGGPAAYKLGVEEEKKKSAIKAQVDESKSLVRKIDEALAGVGPSTTGVVGAISRNIPGTPAKNLNEVLKTVRANIGFDKLQNMRQNSPTGGALGQVSDRENELLQAVRGSLDQAQSLEQIQKNLKELRDHYGNVILAMESQTGDEEADNAIAQVIDSPISENEKRARIAGIRSELQRQ